MMNAAETAAARETLRRQVRALTFLPASTLLFTIDGEKGPGLRFHFAGMNIDITLDAAADLYDVAVITKARNAAGCKVETFSGVFADMLGEFFPARYRRAA